MIDLATIIVTSLVVLISVLLGYGLGIVRHRNETDRDYGDH